MKIKIPVHLKTSLKSSFFRLAYLYSRINKSYFPNDEFGICSICGNFSKFWFNGLFNAESKVVCSCKWDEEFTYNINLINSLHCGYCMAKFRVRAAAQSLLDYFWQGKIKFINELVQKLKNNSIKWSALETSSSDGIFSNYEIPSIIKSEYYDDVPRGNFKGNIKSEDLQNLTFDDNSFDCIISLDVLEHIPDPWIAFSEIKRVLKPKGAAIITVPIDRRNQYTKKLADINGGKINHIEPPSYHSDPLRKEGALVFTNFGTDIQQLLTSKNFNASVKEYRNKSGTAYQYVIMIFK
ncbi:MAG: methyltransferase domain-containing protein [Ignavibacteria bacterium]|nr:methyltransferase domain-containing protein [Ignavibacteria bacterium]